jgi:hypothetical protein
VRTLVLATSLRACVLELVVMIALHFNEIATVGARAPACRGIADGSERLTTLRLETANRAEALLGSRRLLAAEVLVESYPYLGSLKHS